MNSVTVARTAPMMIPPTQDSGDEVDPIVPCDIRSTDAEGLGLCPVLYDNDNNFRVYMVANCIAYTGCGSVPCAY